MTYEEIKGFVQECSKNNRQICVIADDENKQPYILLNLKTFDRDELNATQKERERMLTMLNKAVEMISTGDFHVVLKDKEKYAY